MDADVHQRLSGLISRACSKKSAELEPRLLADIKLLCKLGDNYVVAAWDELWAQLRAPHAQSRLLALGVCEQLFARSRAFRRALLGRLTLFLEAVIGFRADRPLPPPAAAATSLREKGLELLEAWTTEHGGRHKQLPLAVRYLRDTLQYRFPEIASRAAAAEAERAAREDRRRAALRQRLAAVLGPQGEWQEGAAAARQLLLEVAECFAILEEGEQAQQAQQAQTTAPATGAAAAAAADGDGLEWEDVAAQQEGVEAVAAEAAAAAQAGPVEGLAAYGAGGAEEETAAAASVIEPSVGRANGDSGQEVVLETLAGLYRQLTPRTLPQIQDWLNVLGQAEAEGPAQQRDQQVALRAATELRGRLVDARTRCDAMQLDLQALLLSRQRRQEARTQGGQDAAAAAAEGAQQPGGRQQQAAIEVAMQDLFGHSSSSDEGEAGNGRAGEARVRRQQHTAAGPRINGQQQSAEQRWQQWQQRQQVQQRGRQQGDDDFESPYDRIVDPAAPRPRPASQQGQAQAQPQQAARTAPVQRQRSSSLPDEVRRKLAEQAPVLPTGMHTLFWDSKSVPTFVSGHGMEISNHWGPVDVHQELPPERFDELFMLPMPSNRAQQAQQHSNAGGQQGQQQGPQQQQQQQQQGSKRQQDTAVGPWPSRHGGSAAGATSAGSAAAAAADAAGPSSLAAVTAAAPAIDQRAAKRARRAQERAYNEAVIGAGLSDEALARRLQEAEQQQQPQEQAQRSQRVRQAKKMSVRDRLAQKLLRGSAVAAAVRDASIAESEQRRDKFGSRW